MSVLFQGNFQGNAVDPEVGIDNNGRPCVRWEMEVASGDQKGNRARYKGKLDPDSIKYTKRDMMSIGWQGKDVSTFAEDVRRAKKVVAFTAEIAEYNGRQWTSARIGGAAPLAQMDAGKTADVNRWFAESGDVPGAGGGNGEGGGSIPF